MIPLRDLPGGSHCLFSQVNFRVHSVNFKETFSSELGFYLSYVVFINNLGINVFSASSLLTQKQGNPVSIFKSDVSFSNIVALFLYFFKGCIYFQREGGGREEEGEKNTHVCLPPEGPLLGTQACAPTGS